MIHSIFLLIRSTILLADGDRTPTLSGPTTKSGRSPSTAIKEKSRKEARKIFGSSSEASILQRLPPVVGGGTATEDHASTRTNMEPRHQRGNAKNEDT